MSDNQAVDTAVYESAGVPVLVGTADLEALLAVQK